MNVYKDFIPIQFTAVSILFSNEIRKTTRTHEQHVEKARNFLSKPTKKNTLCADKEKIIVNTNDQHFMSVCVCVRTKLALFSADAESVGRIGDP